MFISGLFMRHFKVFAIPFSLLLASSTVAAQGVTLAPGVNVTPCSQPVTLGSVGASEPSVFDDGSRRFVVFLGGGSARVEYYDMGFDLMPGTADDSFGILASATAWNAYLSGPQTDGRFVVYTENYAGTRSIHVIDIGADLRPGTTDDLPSVNVLTVNYPFVPGQGGGGVGNANVRDGILSYSFPVSAWPSLPSPGIAQYGSCDLRQPASGPRSCFGVPPLINMPAGLTSDSKTTALRNYALGSELHLGFLTARQNSFAGLFNSFSLMFESSLQAVLPGVDGAQVTVVKGFLYGQFPVVSRRYWNTQVNEAFDALNPAAPLFEIEAPRPMNTLLDVGENVSSYGTQPLVWADTGGGVQLNSNNVYVQPFLSPGAFRVKTRQASLNAINMGYIGSFNADGDSVAWTQEELQQQYYFSYVQYAICR